MIRVVLTDIEGTTSSISFVKDVLFPYARKNLPAFVVTHTDDSEVQHWLHEAAKEAGLISASQNEIIELLQRWIDADRKSTALKALQGLIWEDGYKNGTYTAHVYPDVLPKLDEWRAGGISLAVYSSGSEKAQQLFFEYSQEGNILDRFRALFDTTIGAKRDVESYRRIAQALECPASDVMFLSDITEELDAARAAGMKTTLLARPPMKCPANGAHPCVSDFSAIVLS